MSFLQRQPIENTSCILMVGRVLGGLPIVIYPHFCTRAVLDVLSSNLHLVRTMCENPVMSRFAQSLVSVQGQRNPDFETLVKDPQSLPIDMPIQPENYLKDKVKEGLSGYIKNRAVLPLFTLDSETKKRQILTDLSNIEPTNPRLLNKIYSCSSLGIQEKVIAKFSNTRSIQCVATQTWVDEDSLVRQLSTMEKCIVDYYREMSLSTSLHPATFKQIFAGHIKSKEPECTTLVAHSLREVLWGRHIEGITMPAQQEQVKIFQWDNILEEHWPNTILMLLEEPTENRYLERGPHNPYFGSQTQQRARKAPLQVLEVGSVVASLRTLMELLGWVQGDPNITKLIVTCIEEKTDIPIEILKKHSRQVYSGTVSHRLTCPSLQRGGHNMSVFLV